MSAIRLRGATSGTTDVVAAAIAGDGVMTLPTGTGTLATAAYVDAAVAAGGKVLQVVSVTKSDTFGLTSATFVDITGLSVTSAALRSTSSRVKITVAIGRSSIATGYSSSAFRLMRDSTAIGVGDAAGVRTQASFAFNPNPNNDANHSAGGIAFTFIDSPATTSTVVYKIQMMTQSAQQGYINRTIADGNDAGAPSSRTVSTITIEEIA